MSLQGLGCCTELEPKDVRKRQRSCKNAIKGQTSEVE
jgi:hypothetical protein